MLTTKVQLHMPLGMRDHSMRDSWAPGLPWLSLPGTKLERFSVAFTQQLPEQSVAAR